eukprot:gnl/MRDRNA2_/MRDRNA2_67083_c0_seq1.p1 gnl/MRDRNA2_/MRDRNA2_67083_c0~~gnl/MRDRNA2_/MRDRNA2_67083_c0_seq1.p1  ORF type:complete len:236 (+),score=8.44 gnl/MRDRNA2_/MRDRNA2_67083_c0_seq1:51-758(+)
MRTPPRALGNPSLGPPVGSAAIPRSCSSQSTGVHVMTLPPKISECHSPKGTATPPNSRCGWRSARMPSSQCHVFTTALSSCNGSPFVPHMVTRDPPAVLSPRVSIRGPRTHRSMTTLISTTAPENQLLSARSMSPEARQRNGPERLTAHKVIPPGVSSRDQLTQTWKGTNSVPVPSLFYRPTESPQEKYMSVHEFPVSARIKPKEELSSRSPQLARDTNLDAVQMGLTSCVVRHH